LPTLWESKTTGKSGYAIFLNEWWPASAISPGSSADCAHLSLTSITDPVIYAHLKGKHMVGFQLTKLVSNLIPGNVAVKVLTAEGSRCG
jgi:hypothetical protein